MTPAFVCPGQGSQTVGMGAAQADAPPAAARFAAARAVLGDDLLDVMFHGPAETLTHTRYAQPAIFLTSVAAADLLAAHDVRPQAVAGHSLGEYSALVVAGVLDFADALQLVRQRAEAMQAACDAEPGVMAAILGLEGDVVQAACAAAAHVGIVDVANTNTVGQVVISGTPEAVAAAGAAAKDAGAKRVMSLPVGGAFHSRLMEPAAEPLARALDATAFRAPSCLFIPNTTGAPLQDPVAIRDALKKQLTAPVCWAQTMATLSDHGIDTVIEVGTGTVLRGMAKRAMRGVPLYNVETPAEADAVVEAMRAAA